ncbi:tetratricopeptide repeat protein [Rhizobium jaguaris]|uniref:tetratricopeptide repeat protein n=1 Tax=Rhizobium jaguaris TaxID=1312183 RepID=UPI001FE04F9E|nr:tetratricopeptide repeat protein [Rhizobium jaguaris]
MDDPNIRTVLFDLMNEDIRRPTYYTVSPHFDDIEIRSFARQRISAIPLTFQAFLEELDRQIAKPKRSLGLFAMSKTSTVAKFFVAHDRSLSEATATYLEKDVIHIRRDLPVEAAKPTEFYKGYDVGFGGIAAELDAKRKIADTILVDAVLSEETSTRRDVELFVLKGAAGNGKTTVLKRVAWDAAASFGALVLFVPESGALIAERVSELSLLTDRRIFICVDRAALRANELARFMRQMAADRVKVTIITAERDSEWNTRCEALEEFVTASHAVRYLSDDEIRDLLERLEKHGSLGLLAEQSPQQRFVALNERAQRQLLVALHEATQGRPFEDIIADEYARIMPPEAQNLYLDICTLHRFGVGVRAGVISRISGIRFEDFQRSLFLPLENIVSATFDRFIKDMVYRARHQHVAEIVFMEALKTDEDKFNQILRLLRGLNVNFGIDKEAFGNLTRGRAIAQAFRSVDMGRALFKLAAEIGGEDAYLLHQEGNFEINHHGGDLDRAETLLKKAEAIATHNDPSIQHSLANLYRKKALEEPNELLRKELRQRALSRLRLQDASGRNHVYTVNTKLLVLIDGLKEMLPANGTKLDPPAERVLVDRMKEIETEFVTAHQMFPDDEYILSAEANYRTAISEHPKALAALEKAFTTNPRQEWLALRLASHYESAGRLPEAKAVLLKVTHEVPTAKQAHFRVGQMNANSGNETERRTSLQHFRSAFSNGDTNYIAQLWYGRQLFLDLQFQEADKVFEHLSGTKITSATKLKPRAILTDTNGSSVRFRGDVVTIEAGYTFVQNKEYGRNLFSHEANSDASEWAKLKVGAEVTYELAFNFKGPCAVSLRSIE